MPRPRKQKKICRLPAINEFGPASEIGSGEVFMSIEEYETLRLIDNEDLTQEECAEIMGVARSTVQRLYNDARKKIADCIVNGMTLKIGGGDFTLCAQKAGQQLCSNCQRHRRGRHGRSF